MRLSSEETIIWGEWNIKDGIVVPNANCDRIEFLISEILIKIRQDKSGWFQLFFDPKDNRFWELSYPESELIGGGPPKLENITYESAVSKYGNLY